jgi:hypothetical protein
MSSVNQKSCWDAGATLGRNKAPKRMLPWTHSPYKTSPCHITLRKQEEEDSCAVRHWLQTCLRDIWQITGEHQDSLGIPRATPVINQHSPLGRLTPPAPQKNLNWIHKKLKTNTQQKDWGAVSALEKGEGARSWPLRELSVNKCLERQKGWQWAGRW